MPRPPARDLAVVIVGLAVLVVSTLAALPPSVSNVELDVFGLVNHVGDIPRALAWAPMQLGNVVAVPAAALVALAARRARLAVGLASSGMLVWVVAKGIKGVVDRGRPGALVDDAVLRDAHPGGLGFPSGHAAVAAVLAVVVWPHLNRAGRVVVVVLTGLVGLLRVYDGAHLPLDIAGGFGLGLVVGGAARLILGWRATNRRTRVDR